MECPREKFSVAIIGCGFMGTAILQGLLHKIQPGDKPAIDYTAWVRSSASLERLQLALGDDKARVKCVAGESIIEIIEPADIVFLGFPPGDASSVLGATGLSDALRGKLIISLLAGVSYDQLHQSLRSDVKDDEHQHQLLRAIPSIGAKINDSVTLIAENPRAGQDEQHITGWLFQELGEVQWLSESLMNEATAAGAASNALIVVAVDAIADASIAEGIPRAAALKIAAACLRSSAGMLLAGGMTPESLKESMSVPKGITINSLLELERGHARSAISDAVRHAIRYTRNMSS